MIPVGEWRELDWRFTVPCQLNKATLQCALAEASRQKKAPCRLVVGEWARADLNMHYGASPILEEETLYVPIVESFRIVQEGSRDLILEVVVGDFPDDGRWYIEDHEGFRIGSVAW